MPIKITGLIGLMIAVAMLIIATEGSSVATVVTKSAYASASASQETSQNNSDIQWFKDQMQISDKYLEQQDGIWGMSRAHFLTMVFLVLFALGALVVFIQQQKRTKEIMELIRKEMKNGNSG